MIFYFIDKACFNMLHSFSALYLVDNMEWGEAHRIITFPSMKSFIDCRKNKKNDTFLMLDEEDYLLRNSDVKESIKQGNATIKSALSHFIMYGISEKRSGIITLKDATFIIGDTSFFMDSHFSINCTQTLETKRKKIFYIANINQYSDISQITNFFIDKKHTPMTRCAIFCDLWFVNDFINLYILNRKEDR